MVELRRTRQAAAMAPPLPSRRHKITAEQRMNWVRILWLAITLALTVMLVPTVLSPSWVIYGFDPNTPNVAIPQYKEIGLFYYLGYPDERAVDGGVLFLEQVPSPYFQVSRSMVLVAMALAAIAHIASMMSVCVASTQMFVWRLMYFPHALGTILLIIGLVALPLQFQEEPFLTMCSNQPTSNVTTAFSPCDAVELGTAYYIAASIGAVQLVVMFLFCGCIEENQHSRGRR